MPQWNQVARSHVAAALAECDRLGSSEFLARYRFRRARAATVWHGGNEYDPIALLGVAHLHATGQIPGNQEVDDAIAARVLGELGFDVVVDEDAMAQLPPPRVPKAKTAGTRSAPATRATGGATPRAGARSTRTSPPAAPRRTKPADVAPKVCPTCYMALPATGICDTCD